MESTFEQPWKRQRLQVPTENKTLFSSPPLDQSLEAIHQNAAELVNHQIDIQGQPFAELRRQARHELLQAAEKHTHSLLPNNLSLNDVSLPKILPQKPIIIGGHQPTLFHPGVWAKNFALHYFATRTMGTAVNLVVDNDLQSTAAIRLPVGDRHTPRITELPFDKFTTPQPWEQATVVDHALFATFGKRVSAAMSAWKIQPVISKIWPTVVNVTQKSQRLADGLTAGRLQIERQWGVQNLELPVSHLCETDSFLSFAAHLFAHAKRFREIHNTALMEYRQVNRIRSRTHPVSELTEQNDWSEMPFWIFRDNTTIRQRLFVRKMNDTIQLATAQPKTTRSETNHWQPFTELPLAKKTTTASAITPAVAVLKMLAAAGIRLRTRALTTTLFSRLFFGDLFVHGIGGAKYDEITDRLITRFFRLPAPKFSTLSATLFLPFAEPFAISPNELSQQIAEKRRASYQPEQFFTAEQREKQQAELQLKKQLTEQQQAAKIANRSQAETSPQERRKQLNQQHERHLQLQQLNKKLLPTIAKIDEQQTQQIHRSQNELHANSVLQNREFSFALFPEESLRSLMNGLLNHPTN